MLPLGPSRAQVPPPTTPGPKTRQVRSSPKPKSAREKGSSVLHSFCYYLFDRDSEPPAPQAPNRTRRPLQASLCVAPTQRPKNKQKNVAAKRKRKKNSTNPPRKPSGMREAKPGGTLRAAERLRHAHEDKQTQATSSFPVRSARALAKGARSLGVVGAVGATALAISGVIELYNRDARKQTLSTF